ncbi:MAG: protein-L-isoaspartate(D-aspartate) O-methyltransferase [Rhodospirillales bacterium]|nr:protein-L-isoaspartate(D-aspartate) O-methyltransferase [Rhodospirillales bacterium]
MTEKMLSLMLEQMIQIIVAHAYFAREQIGKETLDDKVLRAMARVPRHHFVPPEISGYAYADQPLPIGCDKTISQPFIVALMTDLLDVHSTDKILEVGTGLGYHTAILAELGSAVYSMEIVEDLAMQAKKRLEPCGYGDVHTRVGNGEFGWPEQAPFDRILVCAASDLIPAALLGQLKPGGRMVVPTGLPESQNLTLVEKSATGRIKVTDILPVRFAPLEKSD